MPKVSKNSATKGGDHGLVVDRAEHIDGYSVNFIEFRQDIDHTPLLKGLPGDRCPCPHWGYVLQGKLTMRFTDREEVYQAGDAFYAPPGHVPISNEPGTQYVQFSPLDKLCEVQVVLMKNVEQLMGG